MQHNQTRALSIETSCDETAISLLQFERDKAGKTECTVVGNALYSQAAKHAAYGGVYPDLAKREHSRNLVPLLKKALSNSSSKTPKSQITSSKQSEIEQILEREPDLYNKLYNLLYKSFDGTTVPDIDTIAVTVGPGLEPALWVGINFARALSVAWNIPITPVNHMEGHVLSVLVPDNADLTPPTSFPLRTVEFPALALLVSGGHTELVRVNDWLEYEKIGQTRDDAVGEAFDKVARMLDLGYPGGPELSRLAQEARKKHQTTNSKFQNKFNLPRPMINSVDLDFSFSGIKTAVMYALREHGEPSDNEKAQLAREFEDAVVDVLVAKTDKALETNESKTLIIGGGVAANQLLRDRLKQLATEKDIPLLLPHQTLTGDNAFMIGIAGYFQYIKKGPTEKSDLDELRAEGRLSL